jgi:TolB protein
MLHARGIASAVAATVVLVAACAGENSRDTSSDAVRAAVSVPNGGIWIVDVSTGASRPFVDSAKLEGSPVWSPDGDRIAFGRLESGAEDVGDADIWIADVATGALDRVLDGRHRDLAPAWSPDGRWLAFVSDRRGHQDIWIMDLERQRLTQLTNDPATDTSPSFSPDGRQLVFVSDRGGHQELWTVDAAGGMPTPADIPGGGADVTSATWSPSGASIAYIRHPPEQFPELWIARSSGGHTERVNDVIWPGRPAWSPDERTIAVSDQADGHLYLVDARTGDARQLTTGDREDYLPTWSPDGTQIAYTSTPNPPGSD